MPQKSNTKPTPIRIKKSWMPKSESAARMRTMCSEDYDCDGEYVYGTAHGLSLTDAAIRNTLFGVDDERIVGNTCHLNIESHLTGFFKSSEFSHNINAQAMFQVFAGEGKRTTIVPDKFKIDGESALPIMHQALERFLKSHNLPADFFTKMCGPLRLSFLFSINNGECKLIEVLSLASWGHVVDLPEITAEMRHPRAAGDAPHSQGAHFECLDGLLVRVK